MIVRNWMRKAVSVPKEARFIDAARLMKASGSNWISVVDQETLVGTISATEVKQAVISDTPSLEIEDMLSVIPDIRVAARMNRHPRSVLEERTMEEAADIMLREGVSGLPVVDAEGRLKGAIERRDVLKVLISLSGLPEKGLQVALQVPNRPGSIAEIENVVRGYGCRVLGIMSTFKEKEEFRHVYLRLCQCDRTRLHDMKSELEKGAKLLYLADFGEKKTDFYQEYSPPLSERYIG